MKLARLAALFLVTVAALLTSANLAAAGENTGASTAHFTATYDNGSSFGGIFTCSGERIVKTAPKAFVKDSATCKISDIATWPAGTYIIGGTGPDGAVWFSDYDGATAVSGTLVVTDNGDGTGTMNIAAYY